MEVQLLQMGDDAIGVMRFMRHDKSNEKCWQGGVSLFNCALSKGIV